MRRGRQTAPRRRSNLSVAPSAIERQRHVDHRQPTADDEDRRVGAEVGERLLAPRLLGGNAGERQLGVVPGGEDRKVGVDGFAGGEDKPHAVSALVNVETGSARMPRAAGRQRLSRQIGDVVAVGRARNEREGGWAVFAFAPAQPLVQMVRLVGESAHVGDANVQQMARVVGRVGDAAAERSAFAGIDDDDLCRCNAEAPREMRRRQNPSRPAAYDCDPHRPFHD